MKKRLGSAIGIIIVLLLSVRIYSWYSDSKLVDKTINEIKVLLRPYIDNIVIGANGDRYHLRLQTVELSGGIEAYKKRLNAQANVSYGLYKETGEAAKLQNLHTLRMNLWRPDISGDFHTNASDSMRQESSYLCQIFDNFIDCIFSDSQNKLLEGMEVSTSLYSYYKSSRGSSRYDEGRIKFDEYGKVISTGEVFYKSIRYAKDLSMEFTCSMVIEDFTGYNEMNIEVESVQGDYHPLWNVKSQRIDEVRFYYEKGNQKQKIIKDRNTIEKLMSYLESLPFEKLEDQKGNDEILARIYLGEYELVLSSDEIYTNSGYATCKGAGFVKGIIEILD